jgi:hypothetical protein
MTHPRTKTILSHCRNPGAYLRKEFQSRRRQGGGGQSVKVEYFLEPGSVAVAAEYATAAIASGQLVPRDLGLFGADDAQSWFMPLRRPVASRNGEKKSPDGS